MLPEKYRLPKERFQYVYKNGKKIRGQYGMLVSVKEDSLQNPKIGIVVSRKIGNAVKRHRMTRVLRTVFLQLIKSLQLETTGIFLEYIAFEFCDEWESLEKEISSQLLQTVRK